MTAPVFLPLAAADRAVANLLADGHTVREIGRHLVMTEESVRCRIKRMRVTRGAASSVHLVAILFRSGDLT